MSLCSTRQVSAPACRPTRIQRQHTSAVKPSPYFAKHCQKNGVSVFTPSSRSRIETRAAANQAAESAAPVNPYQGEPEWYALVARAEFFFNDVQNEALAEQLRELKRYYEESGREIDFFFVSEPEWLSKFPEAKSVKRPSVALVSTDKSWITFMKLRLDRVLKLDLGNMNIDEATKSTAPLPEFKPPEKWTAPYAPYAYGWWETFMRN